MKHVFIAFFVLLISSVQAQSPFEKGTKTLGGSISGSYSKYKAKGSSYKATNSYIGVLPALGFFVTKGLLVQASPILAYRKDINEHSILEDEISSIEYGIGADLRYYTQQKIFFHAGASYGKRNSKLVTSDITIGTLKSTRNTSIITAGVGYAWMLTSSLAIEPMIAYTHRIDKLTDSSFDGLTNQLEFNVGLRYFITQ